jgi:cyclic pyranopterin phosphate synthase
MAAKQTSTLIPLCHPIAITHVSVDVILAAPDHNSTSVQPPLKTSIPWAGTGQGDAYKWSQSASPKTEDSKLVDEKSTFGRVDISATVSCDGKTGVEMEALTAASTAALTVYDMCKAVDKGMTINGLKVIRKEGGKSGTWVEGVAVVDGE